MKDEVKRIVSLDGSVQVRAFANGTVDLATQGGTPVAGGGMVSKTYSELKTLRDNSQLVPGTFYRITDYVTTTNTASTYYNAQTAGHQFDVIVQALSKNVLSENAQAIHNQGDTYFQDSWLQCWRLQYMFDNDPDEFPLCDPNGKGYIYYMEDENGNTCSYDFKNFLWKRTVEGVDKWYYTFSYIEGVNENETISDFSLGTSFVCLNNKLFSSQFFVDDDTLVGNYNNVFKTNDNTKLCQYNTAGTGFFGNTFGNDCYGNEFESWCYNNTFGDECYGNNFLNYCHDNTASYNLFGCHFGNYCIGNTFGYSNYAVTMGDQCQENTFGNKFWKCSMGYGCSNNTVGNGSGFNTFGDNCTYNEIGDGSEYNIFGDSCGSNVLGAGVHNTILGQGCNSVKFGTGNSWNVVEAGLANIDKSSEVRADQNTRRWFIGDNLQLASEVLSYRPIE